MTEGIDIPGRRGRTGLDQHGRGLYGNPRVRSRDVELLSCDYHPPGQLSSSLLA
jgi:hypothetical protein